MLQLKPALARSNTAHSGSLMVILEEGGDTLMSQNGAVMEAIKREAQKTNISIAPKAENVRGRADTERQSNSAVRLTLNWRNTDVSEPRARRFFIS